MRRSLAWMVMAILSCWGWLHPCWGATISVTMPDDQLAALVMKLCTDTDWPRKTSPEICQAGTAAVVQDALNRALILGQIAAGLPAIHATVEVTP